MSGCLKYILFIGRYNIYSYIFVPIDTHVYL